MASPLCVALAVIIMIIISSEVKTTYGSNNIESTVQPEVTTKAIVKSPYNASKCTVQHTQRNELYKNYHSWTNSSQLTRNSKCATLNGTTLHFRVRTASYAYILLSNTENRTISSGAVYEIIVIGGGHNPLSVIRRAQSKATLATGSTPNFLSGLEPRGFWIRMSNDGTLSVGREGDEIPFMAWRDPLPFQIKYFSFSTRRVGKWEYNCPDFPTNSAKEPEPEGAESTVQPEVTSKAIVISPNASKCTVLTRLYHSWTNSSQITRNSKCATLNGATLHFWVRANSDAHILLSNIEYPPFSSGEVYKIVFGSSSKISRAQWSATKVCVSTPNILSLLEPRGFWIHMSNDGAIAVGKEGDEIPFMSWKDPLPIQIKYFSVMPWCGVFGNWEYYPDFPTNAAKEPEPEGAESAVQPEVTSKAIVKSPNASKCTVQNTQTYEYTNSHSWANSIQFIRNTKSATLNGATLHFRITAESDAHILLSDSENPTNSSGAVYEIVIGAGRNLFSNIKRAQWSATKATMFTPNFLSGLEPRGFWIRMSNDGTIAVGREGDEIPFMAWKDPLPFQIKYFSFRTLSDVFGKWEYNCSDFPKTAKGIKNSGNENHSTKLNVCFCFLILQIILSYAL